MTVEEGGGDVLTVAREHDLEHVALARPHGHEVRLGHRPHDGDAFTVVRVLAGQLLTLCHVAEGVVTQQVLDRDETERRLERIGGPATQYVVEPVTELNHRAAPVLMLPPSVRPFHQAPAASARAGRFGLGAPERLVLQGCV